MKKMDGKNIIGSMEIINVVRLVKRTSDLSKDRATDFLFIGPNITLEDIYVHRICVMFCLSSVCNSRGRVTANSAIRNTLYQIQCGHKRI